MENNEHAEEAPHKLETTVPDEATEVKNKSKEDDDKHQSNDECNTVETEQENSDISPASSSDEPTSSNTRASLPGAYRMRPNQTFSSSDAQAMDDAPDDGDNSGQRVSTGPAVLTAQVQPAASFRNSLTTSPDSSIQAEVMATVVQDSTVVEGTPIDPESIVSELTPPHLTSRKKQRQLVCGAVGLFAVLLAGAVGLTIHFTRSNQTDQQALVADGAYRFIGCYKDKYPTNRDLPVMLGAAEYSHDSCYRGCRLQGFAFFGLQFWGECHCGNTYGQFGKVDCTDCSESAEFYGDNVNCVYEIGFTP